MAYGTSPPASIPTKTIHLRRLSDGGWWASGYALEESCPPGEDFMLNQVGEEGPYLTPEEALREILKSLL